MEERSGPLVVAMKGHPGTGKTTVARAVAAALRCPLLDKDDVRDATRPLERAGVPSSALNELSYAALWRLAATQLGLGLSVVVDCPLSRRAHLDQLLRLSAAAGGRVVVVECRPSDVGEWRRRLEARGAAVKEEEEEEEKGGGWHKPSTWEELRRLVEGYNGSTEYDIGDVPRIVVDTTLAGGPVDGEGSPAAAVLEFIKASEERLTN